jgi:hypothetical protein
MSKITKSSFYLVRNPFSYCFRMAVPQDMHRCVGKIELRYSLRTGYLLDARTKAGLLAGKFQ